jgi:hypothetical protein
MQQTSYLTPPQCWIDNEVSQPNVKSKSLTYQTDGTPAEAHHTQIVASRIRLFELVVP